MRRGFAAGVTLGTAAQLASIGLLLSSAWLIVRAAEQPPVLYLMVAIVSVRFFGISRAVLRYLDRLVIHDAAFRDGVGRRVDVYRDLDRIAPVGVTGRRRGDLLARVVDDVAAVQDGIVRISSPWWVGWGSVVVIVMVVGWLDPVSAVALGVAVVAVAVGLRLLGTPRNTEQVAATAEARGRFAAEVSQLVVAAPDLVAHGAAAGSLAAVRGANEDLEAAQVHGARLAGRGGAWVLLCLGAAAGAIAGLTGDVDRVLIGVLLLAPIALIEPLESWAEAARLTPEVDASRQRIAELAAVAPAIVERDVTAPPGEGFGLSVRDLVVGWSNDLAGPLTFDIAEGQTLAVTGPSGVGKSTLGLTLARLIEPRRGVITLGGVDVVDLDPGVVRSVVGYLGQDDPVFDTSIRENLRVARPDATHDELFAALDAAALGDFVRGLPRGLDTPVGERGSHLSGGERQRLGMARLVLGGHRILVLDEPTEQLDVATADALMDDILALAPERTLIVISHVPQVVERCAARIDL